MSVVPTVTVAQMREVDRIMVDELHIELLQMMENAGRCLAAHTRGWLGGQVIGRRVVVLAGSGGNGGGGLVAARRLTIWGAAAVGRPDQGRDGFPRRSLQAIADQGVQDRVSVGERLSRVLVRGPHRDSHAVQDL